MRWLCFLFLVTILPTELTWAQPEWDRKQQLNEFNRLITELSEVSQARELLEATRIQAPDLERQERAFADSIANLMKSYPELHLARGGEVVAQWFIMIPAIETKYQWVYETFLGYHVAVAGSPDQMAKMIRKVGLEPFFQAQFLQTQGEAMGAETELGYKHWLYEVGHNWLVAQQALLASADSRGIDKVLQPFLRNAHNKGVSEGAYKYLIAPQRLQVRLKILEHIYQGNIALPKLTMSNLYIQHITPWQWLEGNPRLFRELISRVGKTRYGAERFVLSYGIEEFMTLRFNIFSVESGDPQIRNFFSEAADLTVGQQMILLSEKFRVQIFANLVLEKNKAWVLDLIDYAIKNGFTDFRLMGPALAKRIAILDPRWVSWMNQMGPMPLGETVVDIVRKSVLYSLTSKEALVVHKALLESAIRHVENRGFYHPGEVDPLQLYLRKAVRVAELREKILIPRMINSFSDSSPLIWRRFLTEVVVPTQSQSPLRYLVIELLSQQQVTDVETLRILNRIFGVPVGFRKDLRDARLSEVEGELRMLAWDQILHDSAHRGLPFRCSEVYAP